MPAPCPQQESPSAPKIRRPLSPNSRRVGLGMIDGRRREAKVLEQLRAELTQHIGGHPSATQRELIEQAARLKLRLTLMDHHFAEVGRLTDHDSHQYLAWANAYGRFLRHLGLEGAKQQAHPTRDQVLAAFYGKATADGR